MTKGGCTQKHTSKAFPSSSGFLVQVTQWVKHTLHLLRTSSRYIKSRLNSRLNTPSTQAVKTINKCNSKEEPSGPLESALGKQPSLPLLHPLIRKQTTLKGEFHSPPLLTPPLNWYYLSGTEGKDSKYPPFSILSSVWTGQWTNMTVC